MDDIKEQDKFKTNQKLNAESAFSIDDLTKDIYEKNHIVNTPRSIQACRWEGIEPSELLYRPLEDFQQISQSQRVQEMHFQFFEKKRQNLIKKVHQTKIFLATQENKNTFSQTFDNADFSVSNAPAAFKSTDSVTRAQKKQLRQIENLLRNEEKMFSKYEEMKRQNEEREMKIKEEERKQQEIEKQKLAEQRLREIKISKLQEEREKEREKNEQNLFKKAIQEQQKIEILEQERLNEIKKKRNISEEKRKMQIQRAVENLQKLEQKRIQDLKKKKQQEYEHFINLDTKRQIYKQELGLKKKRNQEKRDNAIQSQFYFKTEKFNKFAQKQIELENKYLEILQEKEMKKLQLEKLSKEKNYKIQLTLKQADEKEKQRQKKISSKQKEAERRLCVQKQIIEEEIQFQKEKKNLQELNKQQNQIRMQKRQQFRIQLKIQKAKMMDLRIKMFQDYKQKVKTERVKTNIDSMLQRVEIKEALNQMAVTNKWNLNSMQFFNFRRNLMIKSQSDLRLSKGTQQLVSPKKHSQMRLKTAR